VNQGFVSEVTCASQIASFDALKKKIKKKFQGERDKKEKRTKKKRKARRGPR